MNRLLLVMAGELASLASEMRVHERFGYPQSEREDFARACGARLANALAKSSADEVSDAAGALADDLLHAR